MSKLLPLFTVFILSGYSLNAKINESITKYSYGAIFSGIFVKSSGEILIGDSTVQLSVIVDGNTKTNNYTVIKKTNGLIYFSDGVQTYWFALTSQKGKKKGFEYDTLITFNKDNINIAMYYAKLELN
jgi:hypothetical protein